MNNHITIFEMGSRDGLQNELINIDTAVKVEFVNQLTDSGLQQIEVSSFVKPDKIPQLSDAEELFQKINRQPNCHYSALVPNERGMTNALNNSVDAIGIFTAASESFCQKNINCSIEESLLRFAPVMSLAKSNNIPVRAYISCVMGCPYEGEIDLQHVSRLAGQLIELGCYQISLGDTIGAGSPRQAAELIIACKQIIPVEKIAVHFHDTRGQALANITTCLDLGVRTIDSSVAGLGGCPYASTSTSQATGNVATEDVIYMLHGMGYHTGININKLIATGNWISDKINRPNNSRLGNAGVPHDYNNYSYNKRH